MFKVGDFVRVKPGQETSQISSRFDVIPGFTGKVSWVSARGGSLSFNDDIKFDAERFALASKPTIIGVTPGTEIVTQTVEGHRVFWSDGTEQWVPSTPKA